MTASTPWFQPALNFFIQIMFICWCCSQYLCSIVVPAGTASVFCCNPFIDVYLHMLIAALEFVLHGQGHSSKVSVFTRLPRKQSGRWYMVKHLTATSDRGTRQLTVNPLYSTWNLTLHYAVNSATLPGFRTSSLWGKTSRVHRTSLAAAVEPN
jgi:hypothetical protein